MAGSVSAMCGQLVVCGVAGHMLSPSERRTLASGDRAGVVLFKRNIAPGLENVTGLVREILFAGGEDVLVAVDQEGGRVMRLGLPALALPPMRNLAQSGEERVTAVAEIQGRELRALGFSMTFAPVADVHTREENPIIGDRAFGRTPEAVARLAGAFADGLARAGILSCAKHFPGHGDTTVDSHLALPRVDKTRAELEAVEIAPFRALAKRVDSMMTAHVVYPAFGPLPATLLDAVCTELLRTSIGFDGVLFSDDLEMKAIELQPGDAAIRAVAAGCDIVLVCSRPDLADEIHEALVVEATRSVAFRARCEVAAARSLEMRRRVRAQPSSRSITEITADTTHAMKELA